MCNKRVLTKRSLVCCAVEELAEERLTLSAMESPAYTPDLLLENSPYACYVTQANFTTKPRFEIKNKRSFTEMNSQGSRVEKNTHAQKVQMQKILFTNEACW